MNDACEKKRSRVGSQGSRLKIKAGGGPAWGRAQPPPAMRTKKEAHGHKSRRILIKIKKEKINPNKRCLWKKESE